MALSPILSIPLPNGTDSPALPAQLMTAITALEKYSNLAFPTTAAFTAKVPSPIDGMVRYIDATKTLELRVNGAWVVLLTTTAGKGLRFENYGGTGVNIASNITSGTLYTKIYAGFEANRTYLLQAIGTFATGGAVPLELDFELKNGTTRLAKDFVRLSTTGPDYIGMVQARFVTGASPGSVTFNVTANRITGTVGFDVHDAGDSPFRFWITDDGGDTTLVV